MIPVFYTAGDGSGWAIDEDLRLIRESVGDLARPVPLPWAGLVHSPFWVGLAMHNPRVLQRKFVVAHADNPPFFYLTQPGFLSGQSLVDLWIARSREAFDQFSALRFPVRHIPYAIDPGLFFPLDADARRQIRERLGIPAGTYVIGNFHRDSEGADLGQPKLQKAPELLVRICSRLAKAGAKIHVLLAGPRRHWIRTALAREGIPFTFAGQHGISGDDLRENILPRIRLNELYNACDVHVVPSRWEGGPQSVMECAAARVKSISTPVGVALDILEPASLFRTVAEATDLLLADCQSGILDRTVEPQHARWSENHTLAAMRSHLRALYAEFGQKKLPSSNPLADSFAEGTHQWRRRLAKPRPTKFRLLHEPGSDRDHDEAFATLRRLLRQAGLLAASGEDSVALAGAIDPKSPRSRDARIQIPPPGSDPASLCARACMVFPTVHDAVAYRVAGGENPLLVCPIPLEPSKETGPLAIADQTSSASVLRAMAARRPVHYPPHGHWATTVQLGGIPHHGEPPSAPSPSDAADFAALIRPPTEAACTHFFRSLAEGLA